MDLDNQTAVFPPLPDIARQIVLSVPAAVAIFDREVRYRAHSRRWLEDYHLGDQNLLGRSHYEVFPDIPERWREHHRRCLAGESLRNDEDRWERADGSVEWVKWELQPYRLPDGTIVGLVMLTEVISARKEDEARLRESEERFRGLVETTADFIWEVDACLAYTYASPRVQSILGYAPEELIGRTPWDLMPPEEAIRVNAEIGDEIAERRPIRAVPNVNRHRDGHLVVLETSGVPFFDAEGNWRGYRGIDRDVTRRIRAEKERARLLESEREVRASAQRQAAQMGALLESLVEGVAVFDAAGNIVLINEAGRRIFGVPPGAGLRTPEAYRRLDIRDVSARPLPFEEWPVNRALRGGCFDEMEVLFTRPDGLRRRLVFAGSHVRDEDGKVALALNVFRDVTHLRELEEQREDFVRTISHDLRNPLAVITGQADWLRHMLAGKELPREQASVESILRGARRMNAMLQDLSESARLEAGRMVMRLQPTDLQQLVQDIVGRVGSLADRARIRIVCPGALPPVAADPDRIERVIVNLITNALKYSPADSPIVVSLERQGDEAVVSVTDQGVGIAPSDLPHIFERFFRAGTVGKTEGLGLGLYIARLISEAHHGRVWVESELGKGSTFRLALPIVKS